MKAFQTEEQGPPGVLETAIRDRRKDGRSDPLRQARFAALRDRPALEVKGIASEVPCDQERRWRAEARQRLAMCGKFCELLRHRRRAVAGGRRRTADLGFPMLPCIAGPRQERRERRRVPKAPRFKTASPLVFLRTHHKLLCPVVRPRRQRGPDRGKGRPCGVIQNKRFFVLASP